MKRPTDPQFKPKACATPKRQCDPIRKKHGMPKPTLMHRSHHWSRKRSTDRPHLK